MRSADGNTCSTQPRRSCWMRRCCGAAWLAASTRLLSGALPMRNCGCAQWKSSRAAWGNSIRMDQPVDGPRDSSMRLHRTKMCLCQELAMPKIDIRRPHQLPVAEARAVVEQVAARMREKFGMEGRWLDDTLLFSRPGVSGSIAVGQDAIQVKAELGLLLAPLKGMIEQEIQRKLDEHFA